MGEGEEPEAETENVFMKLIRFFKNIFDRLMHEFNIIKREIDEVIGK